MSVAYSADASDPRFHHEAWFYDGMSDFIARLTPFIAEGVANDESVLVAVDDLKIRRLRQALGADADAVTFRPMGVIGRNPGCIISAWADFVADNAGSGRAMRGVGEPVWAERNPYEMEECVRHEQLLNVAFNGSGAWQLICPYDRTTLSESVLADARRSHPFVSDPSEALPSTTYGGLDECRNFDLPLSPSPPEAFEIQFSSADTIRSLRVACESQAERGGLPESRCQDLGLAINEVTTNSLRYGGGSGSVRIWSDELGVCCEVSDRGHITDPLVGRHAPRLYDNGGRGLWLANQLCDLVQIRSGPGRTVVRLHVWR